MAVNYDPNDWSFVADIESIAKDKAATKAERRDALEILDLELVVADRDAELLFEADHEFQEADVVDAVFLHQGLVLLDGRRRDQAARSGSARWPA